MSHLRAHRDEDSADWFDGLAAGRLLIRQCPACGHGSRPDATACAGCGSAELEWSAASGAGTVVSLIVDHSGTEPRPLGLVELDEGPWMHAQLTPPDVVIGDRVRLTISSPQGSEPIPVFVVES